MALVAAFALPHTPQLLVRPPTEDRDLVLRVHAAYAEVKRRLASARLDAVCVIGGDHVEGFFLNAVPALAVFVGRTASGEFGRYRYAFDVHEPLARAVAEQGIEAGFDLTYSQEVRLDYAFYVPLHFTMPAPRLPIVPLYVNVYLPPQPAPRRCYAWARRCGGSSTHAPSGWRWSPPAGSRTFPAPTATPRPTTTSTAGCWPRWPRGAASRPPG